MLKIQDFNLLALKYKEQYTFEKGQLIMRRSARPFLVGLFQLPGFYAEVWYDTRTNKICEVIPHEEKTVLESYSNYIELSKLY